MLGLIVAAMVALWSAAGAPGSSGEPRYIEGAEGGTPAYVVPQLGRQLPPNCKTGVRCGPTCIPKGKVCHTGPKKPRKTATAPMNNPAPR